MIDLYSDRIKKTKSSFTREILKVTETADVISFAGGLPNPISFPLQELSEASERIIRTSREKVFQYSTTEGYLPLRQLICDRYEKRFGLKFAPEDIMITTGSQQGLDLIGKTLVNKGDGIIIEEPGYLGAIQAFSLCEPEFIPVKLEEDGVNLEELENALSRNNVKIFYTVPNFQNPTGITYSQEKRKAVYELLQKYNVVLVEDDPYSELRFEGEALPYIGAGRLEYSVLFGTFSKTITPGMRLGFLCTKNKQLMYHLNTAKQGSDLHTNIFAQYLISDYLQHNDYEVHISRIKTLYKEQSHAMLTAIDKYFPSYVTHTTPLGGMFLWVTLENKLAAVDLLAEAAKQKVLFVPGDPFYTNKEGVNTLRLNYTNSDIQSIEEGIHRLGSIFSKYC
jgi:Transcriptional regulators containing a DNA-binding HTH domain and an aminotransferase domain (MocR family) and their eukaryotic orthologs